MQDDRHAVRDQDGQHRGRVGGDQRVRVRHREARRQDRPRPRATERAAAPVGRGDHGGRRAVRLRGADHVTGGGAEHGRGPAAVFQYQVSLVADVQSEVK